jgi:transcriptional regulator of acetoin/glycerol metabolism
MNIPQKLEGASEQESSTTESFKEYPPGDGSGGEPSTGRTPTLESLPEKGIQVRQGNLSLVAKDLGISRTTLWRRMKEYQIEPLGNEEADISE